jgi:hypothetical protein
MSVSVSVTLEGKILFRSIETGQFIQVRPDHGEMLLQDLLIDEMLHEEKEEDTMMGRVDSSEWIGYGFDNEPYVLDQDGTLIHEGQFVPNHEEDMIAVSKVDESWSYEDNVADLEQQIDAMEHGVENYDLLGQYWGLVYRLEETTKKMNEWAQQPWGPDMFDNDEKVSEGVKTEYMDYYQEEETYMPTETNRNWDAFQLKEIYAKQNRKARFAVGRFMSELKTIVGSKMSKTEMNYRIGVALHKEIRKTYDRKWTIGKFSGYVRNTGHGYFKMNGKNSFGLLTAVLLRSVVMWVTKNQDLALSWCNGAGELAWNNNGGIPAKNRFADKIGALYDIKGHAELQTYLKDSCLGYYLGK